MKTMKCDKIYDWIEQCYEKSTFQQFLIGKYENEFELASKVYCFQQCRRAAEKFLNSLQAVTVCSAEESESLRIQGNKIYKDQETLPQAALMYTRAIYKAPNDSIQLAQAHANRAAALYKLKEFGAACDDCICAIKFNHPETRIVYLRLAAAARKLRDKHKLQDCLKLLKTANINEKSIIDQLRTAVEKIETNSHTESIPTKPKEKKIKILSCKERGRYLVADEPIQPNEIIFSEEAAVSAPANEYRQRFHKTKDSDLTFFCDNCLEHDIIPFPCYCCRTVFYCSKKCRENHVPTHRYECKGFQIGLSESDSNFPFRFLLATFDHLLVTLKQISNGSTYTEAVALWPAVLQASKQDDLMGVFFDFQHFHSVKSSFQDAMIATLWCCYLSNRTDFFEQTLRERFTLMQSQFQWEIIVSALLLRFSIQSKFNAFSCLRLIPTKPFVKHYIKKIGLCNSLEMRPYGRAVYRRFSLINNACDPTCSVIWDKSTASLVCQKPLAKGDEITLCYYFDEKRNFADRRKDLWNNYGFLCDCSRCKDDYDSIYVQSNRVFCTCGTALVVNHDIPTSQKCPQCGRRLHATIHLLELMVASHIPDSGEKYFHLYGSYKLMEKLVPKTSSTLWGLVAREVLYTYLTSKNGEIYCDEKLNSYMIYIAVDILKIMEEHSCTPMIMRAVLSLTLLDLLALRWKNRFAESLMEYNLNKIKQTFWLFGTKERKWLKLYYDQYVGTR